MVCRLSRHELLSNPSRGLLYRTIVERPGIPFLELLAALRSDAGLAAGAGHGMLMHHLYVLKKFHLVVSRKAGRFRRYFQNGGTFGRATGRIALLQTPPVGLIARAVQENGGASQMELLARLKPEWAGTRQSLAYHLRRLESQGLAASRRRGPYKEYHPTPDLGRLLAYADASKAEGAQPDRRPVGSMIGPPEAGSAIAQGGSLASENLIGCVVSPHGL